MLTPRDIVYAVFLFVHRLDDKCEDKQTQNFGKKTNIFCVFQKRMKKICEEFQRFCFDEYKYGYFLKSKTPTFFQEI
jgi:hypothetical protein